MNFKKLLFNFEIGIAALLTNRVRAILTSLGIIFGVASVIAMLAIGKGAEREILEQIKQVGSNNIVIKAKTVSSNKQSQGSSNSSDASSESSSPDKKGGSEKRNLSQGLNMSDVNAISSIATVKYCSPEIEQEVDLLYNGLYKKGYIIGVSEYFFENSSAGLSEGSFFSDEQTRNAEPVCVIGKNIKTKLFPSKSPIGEYLKCGKNWLRVVGVLDNKSVENKDMEKLAIRNINDDVFMPLNTMLLRYSNRSLLTVKKMSRGMRFFSAPQQQPSNYNQLDKVVVHITESQMVSPTVEIIGRLLQRRHVDVRDYEIVVPELLLKQEQKTKELFNVVLAIIASISLIVGGIGIMNIMLASVLERTREIGLRLSMGATKRDISMQFLGEAVSISVTGGIIGIILGVGISRVIEKITDIHTIVSGMSIMISFSISVIIGLIFGILPAKKAAANDPVVSLRS